MAINLLNLTPHKVSQDLSGYITYIYGSPKTGKTTLAVQMEKALLLAFEPGYHALPGVIAQDVVSWSDMKQVYKELKKPEVKETFSSVIVDTIDIAADRCKKYICQQNGIEDLGELGYGKGWTKFKEEFNEVFRGLTQMGYAVFFIGHDKEVSVDTETGTTKTIIRPALSTSTRTVIAGMSDIYGYAHQKYAGENSVLTLRCSDGSIECGCRFKYIPDEIPMSYTNLVNAIQEAIQKEADETNGKFVTTEKMKPIETKSYDYDKMMAEIQTLIAAIMDKNQSNATKISSIIEKYLGKNRKVMDCTPDQCESMELILIDLRELNS